VLFGSALFVTPQNERAVFAAAVKRSTQALQKENPRPVAATSLLWQKFGEARQAAKKLAGTRPLLRHDRGENRRTTKCDSHFIANGDPYSYASAPATRAQITHFARSG